MAPESGKWWRGNTREDFEQFLRERWSRDLAATAFPECDGCGCLVYRLSVDPGEGVRRACVACGTRHVVCGPDVEGGGGDKIACGCGKNQFEIVVGYAPSPARVAVAFRCLACGNTELAHQWSLPEGTTEAILEQS